MRTEAERSAGQDEPPALGLDGAELVSITVNFQVHLNFGETVITIETPFRLRVSGVTHCLDPEERAALGPLLAAYPATVVTTGISSNRTLRIELTGDTVIEVDESPMYEAWQVSGPGGRLIVCPPAGGSGLAIWS